MFQNLFSLKNSKGASFYFIFSPQHLNNTTKSLCTAQVLYKNEKKSFLSFAKKKNSCRTVFCM